MGRSLIITRNAIMAVAQAVISGIVLFLLYRYLLKTIGSELVGTWAIANATASLSRIGEMGFTGSAVKFTARSIARGKNNEASEVVQTTAITVGVALALVLALGYQGIVWLVELILPVTHVAAALAILPYATISVWISGVAGVFISGLDGTQRVDYRAVVMMMAAIFFLGLTWLLVPEYGLHGLIWAQIGQGALTLLASLALLRKELSTLPLLPSSWRYSLFREMFQYGVNFQVISIFSMLFEPVTKALMGKFGGLTSTAYYEMANRMVMQFRALLISANQVMVPQVADFQESAPENIQKAYLDSYRVVFFLALPLFASVAAVAPLASELWIGRYEQTFVSYSLLLAAGFWYNTLSGPAYFVNLGTGLLRWNILAHVVIGVLNIVLGFLLGVAFDGSGVASGYVLALIIGSSLITLGYHRDHRIPLGDLLPIESKRLFLACCAGLLVGWTVFHFLEPFQEPVGRAILSLVVCITAMSHSLWIHPLRTKIGSRLWPAKGEV
jgi:O-antigen/teichoic acid export membrane protein